MINLTDLSGAVNVLNATALALKKNNVWEGKYIAVVAKHGTPCGLGVADSKKEALERMVSGDPLAAFGGAMLANFPLDEDDANILKTFKLENGQKRIYDLIAVPDIDEKTTELLARKDDKCRIFVNDTLADIENIPMSDAQVEKQVRGGIVVCDAPRFILDMASIDMTNHSGRKLSASELADLCIAHSVCALSKSNTVTLVKDGTLLANASGQQSRVQCVKLALMKLQEFHPDAKNFTAASDSFFPFTDGPELLIDGGASTIFATSGSKADEKVIELMLRKNINFITIPDKTGRLFYGH